jgi:hypothetical protein
MVKRIFKAPHALIITLLLLASVACGRDEGPQSTAVQTHETGVTHEHGDETHTHEHGDETHTHEHGDQTHTHEHGDETHTHEHGDQTHTHEHGDHTHTHESLVADTAGTYVDTTGIFFDGVEAGSVATDPDHEHGPDTHTHD